MVVGADGIHSELRPHVVPAVEAGLPRHDLLPRPGAARAPAGLADGPLADVGRSVEALPRLPGAPRHDGQLRRLRADRRGDEGVVVRAGRPAGAAPRVRRLGSAHRRRCSQQVDQTFRWALYDREPLPTWSQGRLTLAGRRGAPDAAAPRPGRQPVDRGRHGARHHPRADRCRTRSRRAAGLRAAAPRARRRGPARRPATGCASIPRWRPAGARRPASWRTPSSASSSTLRRGAGGAAAAGLTSRGRSSSPGR